MSWKVDEESGTLVVDEETGHPMWDDGEKVEPFDPDRAMSTIQRLNSESAGRRKELEKAQGRLKYLDGIEDPDEYFEKANQALETVQKLDDSQLIDAGKVDELKQSIRESYEGKIKEKDKALSEWEEKYHAKEREIDSYMVGQKFATSGFIQDETFLTPEIAQSHWGRHFKNEDGQLIAYWRDGDPIYSKSNPGEYADFDEALRMIVDRYEQKDRILKGSGASGSGASGDATARKERGRWGHIKSRADFRSDKEKAEFIGDKGLGAFKELPDAA